MSAIDTIFGELGLAVGSLQAAVQRGASEYSAGQSADAAGVLVSATSRFVEAGGELTATLQQLQSALRTVATSAQTDNADEMEAHLESFADQVTSALHDKQQSFQSMIGDLRDVMTEEIECWMADAVDGISERIEEATESVGQAAEQALQHITVTVKGAVDKIGTELSGAVEERCSGALNSAIEAAVDGALTAVTETLITTQIGTAVTSAIGPYLPSVIALRRSVGAIQSDLDAMRMGV